MRTSSKPPCLYKNDKGTASLEYLIVLTLVTIGMAGAIAALGPGVVEFFEVRVLWLSLPIP